MYGLIDTSTLTDIADAIRGKLGVQTQYKPGQMPEAIESISGGGITPTGTKSITANGTYDVASYASAEVNVPSVTPTGTKQVSITANGTTTEDVASYANAQITVNVVNEDYEDALVALGVTEDLTDGIVALTTYANGVTGESDTTLSDAVASLADGYGQGGGISQGIEIVTDANGKITDYIIHGFEEVPALLLNYVGYNGNTSDAPLPTISFADKPISFNKWAVSNSKAKIDFSGLSELEKVAGEYAFATFYISQDPCSNVVVNLPKFKGYVDNTYSGINCFRSTSQYAYKTFVLPVMTNIPKYAWYGYTATGLDITIGSIGHAVTDCQGQSFSSTSSASGTVTIYTDGSHLDALKTKVESGAGSNLTFVYKASEATTYNGTSYQAGDTITV